MKGESKVDWGFEVYLEVYLACSLGAILLMLMIYVPAIGLSVGEVCMDSGNFTRLIELAYPRVDGPVPVDMTIRIRLNLTDNETGYVLEYADVTPHMNLTVRQVDELFDKFSPEVKA